MPEPIIYSRHKLAEVEDEGYQTFGDLLFYPNGAVKLGPKCFTYGTPIHRHQFGANLVAIRYVHSPNELELAIPSGGLLRFRYRPFFRSWDQLVAIDDPRLYRDRARFGFLIAKGLFYGRLGARWLMVEALKISLWMLLLAVVCLLLALF